MPLKTIGPYQIHPVLDCVPRASDMQRSKIRESLSRDGFDPDHPILRYNGFIINGRERLSCCLEINVPPKFRDWQPRGRTASEIDAELRRKVDREDLRRRHLSGNEYLVSIAELFKPLAPGRPKAADKEAAAEKGSIEPITLQEVADAAGTSKATLKRTLAMVDGCIKPIVEAVRKNQLSPSDASNVADLSPSDQRKCLKEVKAKKSHSLTAARSKLCTKRDGLSAKTETFWVTVMVPMAAESRDLAVDMVEKGNALELPDGTVIEAQATAVGKKKGEARTFVRCARCNGLMFEGDKDWPDRKIASDGVRHRQCSDGKDD